MTWEREERADGDRESDGEAKGRKEEMEVSCKRTQRGDQEEDLREKKGKSWKEEERRRTKREREEGLIKRVRRKEIKLWENTVRMNKRDELKHMKNCFLNSCF